MQKSPETTSVNSFAPQEKPGFWGRAYEMLIDGGPAKISVVERIDEPMTVFESMKHTAFSALQGAAISGILSGLVSGTIGALWGAGTSRGYTENLDNAGQFTLGGNNIPGTQISGFSITLADGESLRGILESSPAVTTGALNGINSALNTAGPAALVGAGVGAIKGGWADRITKERELIAARPLEQG